MESYTTLTLLVFTAHQYYVRVESSKSNQTVVSYGRILLTLVGDSALNETFPLTRYVIKNIIGFCYTAIS